MIPQNTTKRKQLKNLWCKSFTIMVHMWYHRQWKWHATQNSSLQAWSNNLLKMMLNLFIIHIMTEACWISNANTTTRASHFSIQIIACWPHMWLWLGVWKFWLFQPLPKQRRILYENAWWWPVWAAKLKSPNTVLKWDQVRQKPWVWSMFMSRSIWEYKHADPEWGLFMSVTKPHTS
jgi:hypothetical protein